jgi:hypothetical protein
MIGFNGFNSVNGGRWLACDSIDSVQLIHRGVCIAGKPAPTLIGFAQVDLWCF